MLRLAVVLALAGCQGQGLELGWADWSPFASPGLYTVAHTVPIEGGWEMRYVAIGDNEQVYCGDLDDRESQPFMTISEAGFAAAPGTIPFLATFDAATPGAFFKLHTIVGLGELMLEVDADYIHGRFEDVAFDDPIIGDHLVDGYFNAARCE